MKLDYNGQVQWVFGNQNGTEVPYRVKIQKLDNFDTMSLMSRNFSSSRGGNLTTRKKKTFKTQRNSSFEP